MLIVKQIDIFLHPLLADPPRDFLIDRHGGSGDCGTQGVILVPGLDAARDAIPFEKVFIGIADHSGLERDQRIWNLESRGRQLRLARTVGVAGDDEVIVDLVADEGAGGSGVRKKLGEIGTDFAARRRIISPSLRWQDGGGGQDSNGVAAGDREAVHGATMPAISW
jgi:hypothetical protein